MLLCQEQKYSGKASVIPIAVQLIHFDLQGVSIVAQKGYVAPQRYNNSIFLPQRTAIRATPSGSTAHIMRGGKRSSPVPWIWNKAQTSCSQHDRLNMPNCYRTVLEMRHTWDCFKTRDCLKKSSRDKTDLCQEGEGKRAGKIASLINSQLISVPRLEDGIIRDGSCKKRAMVASSSAYCWVNQMKFDLIKAEFIVLRNVVGMNVLEGKVVCALL